LGSCNLLSLIIILVSLIQWSINGYSMRMMCQSAGQSGLGSVEDVLECIHLFQFRTITDFFLLGILSFKVFEKSREKTVAAGEGD
jgi:hypothetical protein